MKYITMLSLTLAVIIMLICASTFATGNDITSNSFLRIHIRANSNSVVDQTVKYEIKNEIVNALMPILSIAKSKDEAIKAVNNNFDLIERVANNVLSQEGFDYTSHAKLTEEYFPTRSYNQVVLNSGFYDALILELGEANGNNWWCVVYPPLCFVNNQNINGNNIVYKSKLLEIIKQFFN